MNVNCVYRIKVSTFLFPCFLVLLFCYGELWKKRGRCWWCYCRRCCDWSCIGSALKNLRGIWIATQTLFGFEIWVEEGERTVEEEDEEVFDVRRGLVLTFTLSPIYLFFPLCDESLSRYRCLTMSMICFFEQLLSPSSHALCLFLTFTAIKESEFGNFRP